LFGFKIFDTFEKTKQANMKKLLATLFVLFTIVFWAYSTNLDSLKMQLSKKQGHEKLSLLQEININYLFVSADSCIKYGELAVSLANDLNDFSQVAQANKRMGYASYRIGNYNESINYYNKALSYFIGQKEYLKAAIITNLLGDTYSRKSDYAKALDYFVETEKSCDTLINNPRIESAVKQLSSMLYINIGLLYFSLDSLEKPLMYFNKALAFSKEIRDSTRIAASYSNIGMIYYKKKNFEKSLARYFASLEISQKIGNLDYEKATLNNIANIYLDEEKYDSCMFYYEKSKSLNLITNDKNGLSQVYRNIATVQLLQHNNSGALQSTKAAMQYSQESGIAKEIYLNNKMLSKIYFNKGDYQKAYEYFYDYSVLKDSISGVETRKNVAEIEAKYTIQKKEEENKLLKKDIEIERHKSDYLLFMTITLSLVGVISLALFYFIRKNSNTKKQLAESESARLKLELDSQKRELTMSALSVSRNLEFNNSLIKEINNLSKHLSKDGISALSSIEKKLARQQSDKGWKEFEKRFLELHSDFYERLLIKYPALTRNEVKLSAFLKLGMSTKEICSITFQSLRGVETARLRLRKKLKLEKHDNLSMFLQKF